MALTSTVSESNWNLEMLVFVNGAETGVPGGKNPWRKDES